MQQPICEKDYSATLLPRLLVFKRKERRGQIDRIVDETTVIGKGLIKKKTATIEQFLGCQIELTSGL